MVLNKGAYYIEEPIGGSKPSGDSNETRHVLRIVIVDKRRSQFFQDQLPDTSSRVSICKHFGSIDCDQRVNAQRVIGSRTL